MAFKWDLRQGCFTEDDVYGVKLARKIGFVYNFTPENAATALDEAKAHAAANGAPGMQSAYPNDTSGCVLVGRRCEAVDHNFSIVYDYERPGGAVTSEGDLNKLYIVGEDVGLTTVDRVRLPHVNGGQPVMVGWTENTTGMPEGTKPAKIAPQLARYRIQKPTVRVTLRGIFTETPTFGGGDKVGGQAGKVNSTDFMGLPRGFWLFAGGFSRRDPKQERRVVQFTLLSMLDEDWSEWVTCEHPSGLVPPLDVNALGSDIYPTKNNKYFTPSADHLADTGVARVGVYVPVDFNVVFESIDYQTGPTDPYNNGGGPGSDD